ncbi:MAG TPA: methyltransferase domain-containing protein [Gemmatimonadaceae bacterium]|nr:methyltransferase domain-containing protein [Gemmatimonadaceae bacterium]
MPLSSPSPVLSAEATALVNQTLEQLGAQFDIVRTDVVIAGREVRIHHPRNADALIDEQAFEDDERLPYWADVWPSSRVLAERVATMPVDGRRFLELGCGAGLVSVAAAIAGFDVTATDYYEEALRFTALNVLVNTGALIDTRIGDWRRFPHDIGRFELVVASDVLYEQPHASLIAGVLDRTLTARGSGIIADPGRVAAPRFVDECKERGMTVAMVDRVPFEEGNIRQTIDLYEVRRR